MAIKDTKIESDHITAAKFLYAPEHVLCPNYDNSRFAGIEKIVLSVGEHWQTTPAVNYILFVNKGSIRFSFGYYTNQLCPAGNFFLLSATHHIYIYAEEDTQIIIFRLYNIIQFCDRYKIENLKHQAVGSKNPSVLGASPCLLKINDIMFYYFDLLERCLDEGLNCRYYFEDKITELFFILRAFYPKEDLVVFFNDVLSEDVNFSDFVICNHNKYRSVEELATAMNHSTSGFQKHFKKVFGVAPYKWMLAQKTKEIYHRICTDNIAFKLLSDELGFSSTAHFHEFVKNSFGQTPGEIRKNHKAGTNPE